MTGHDGRGLSQDDASKQVNTLLYCLGEEAEDILASTNPFQEETRAFFTVILKFDSFFKICKNVIFERARFNREKQLEGESTEQYITHLYHLAENYDCGELKSEMIRDRLVVGIKDSALSESLHMDTKLTLEKSKQRIRLLCRSGISFCCQSHLVPELFSVLIYIPTYSFIFLKCFFYYSCNYNFCLIAP